MKTKRAQRPITILQTARSILCMLQTMDISREQRAELELAFTKLEKVSIVENDRWNKYLKSDKALSRPPQGD